MSGDASSSAAGESSSAARLDKANDRIRDAAKWLIASAAAVAAALIAGSQLSSIGKLPVGLPTSLENARLWIALVGAVGGLTAVVYVLWTAVQILPEEGLTLRELIQDWDRPTPRTEAAITFLKERPKYLQGFDTPKALEDERQEAVVALGAEQDPAKVADLQGYIGDLDKRVEAVEARASNRALEARFDAMLGQILRATAGAAIGIIAFAWAANPPPATPSASVVDARLRGAFLRDAKLANAKLDHADMTGADLTGADLDGASITGVVWSDTTCPDGVNSNQVGNSCAGHLKPKT